MFLGPRKSLLRHHALPAGGLVYQGPGDIAGLSTPIAWCGLRAFTAALAASAPHPVIDIADTATGTHTATINHTTTGFLDEAAVTSFIVSFGVAAILKIYDQGPSGNFYRNTNLATSGQIPIIRQNSAGTHSAIYWNTATGSPAQFYQMPSITAAQPFVFSCFDFGETGGSLASQLGGQLLFNDGVAGTNAGPTYLSASPGPSNNTWNAQNVLLNGASSIFNLNGNVTNGAAGAGVISADIIILGSDVFADQTKLTRMLEFGIWAGNQSASFAALNAQQHAQWGV